ncbi:flagellar basal body L-ring protein FlgH [Noviherbaspirillum sp. 17J57-3]|uniref:Flagellar basal body L-ring protein FlgH n=2 Tax=Noviherbaspirillum galbum TaxID=2709383 RepID=A0A6B3SQ41_9BURK|nr:flagellar basal body L-ring protein FlgH [Noviherbaspirillum galbum]
MQACAACAVSLYQEEKYQPLTADRKARQAGDALTVLIYENASATSSANTSAARDAGVQARLELGHDSGMSAGTRGGIKFNNQLDGRGRTQREGRVLGTITVRVVSVLDNGDLAIAGEQVLDVNNERQQIRIEGKVRPQDVSDGNTVQSTRVAEARISYVGDGDIAERQRSAWWQRMLTWFGM